MKAIVCSIFLLGGMMLVMMSTTALLSVERVRHHRVCEARFARAEGCSPGTPILGYQSPVEADPKAAGELTPHPQSRRLRRRLERAG